MKDHNKHKYKAGFKGFFHQLLQIDFIRYLVARYRYIYFTKIKNNLKTLNTESSHVSSNTVSHNLKGLNDFAAVRPLAIVKPLSVIESLSKDARILSIGPRSEGELLALVGYGFLPENIIGLDLITYSPWVKIGDMHDIQFPDNYFDSVILGWVLAYSNTPELAAREVVRVLKPGGIVAIGVEYPGIEGREQVSKLDYVPGAGRLTKHVDDILKYFEGFVDNIHFNHSIIEERKDFKGSVIVIFSTKK